MYIHHRVLREAHWYVIAVKYQWEQPGIGPISPNRRWCGVAHCPMCSDCVKYILKYTFLFIDSVTLYESTF